MSLAITPFPTASGMARAMAASNTGIAIAAKYIGVGEGLQTIKLDDAGRAITDTMKKPVAWLPILTSKKITAYQHQMVVDFSGVRDSEWLFSECVLADENKQSIAIYGNPQQALMAVSPAVDRALVAINMVLATLPAGSINIVHQDIPFELFMSEELATLHNAISSLCRSAIQSSQDRDRIQLSHDAQMFTMTEKINKQAAESGELITQLQSQLHHHEERQELFNTVVHNGFGTLSNINRN